MPRAHRHFLPGYVWHITHRCHHKAFLFKFAKDRKRYCHWLFEAKKRYGFCVLNYMVTSNHIHLLVYDTGKEAIPRSLQLIAGRTAQEYNRRKQRRGAFWEDRYHATAIQTDSHLLRCLVYIDLNMVRAGVVSHPSQWADSGYYEIQSPPARKSVIDLSKLIHLCGLNSIAAMQQAHRQWIETALVQKAGKRQGLWSESQAVGGQGFVEQIQGELGIRAKGRQCRQQGESYQLKESTVDYNFGPENRPLSLNNRILWDSYG